MSRGPLGFADMEVEEEVLVPQLLELHAAGDSRAAARLEAAAATVLARKPPAPPPSLPTLQSLSDACRAAPASAARPLSAALSRLLAAGASSWTVGPEVQAELVRSLSDTCAQHLTEHASFLDACGQLRGGFPAGLEPPLDLALTAAHCCAALLSVVEGGGRLEARDAPSELWARLVPDVAARAPPLLHSDHATFRFVLEAVRARASRLASAAASAHGGRGSADAADAAVAALPAQEEVCAAAAGDEVFALDSAVAHELRGFRVLLVEGGIALVRPLDACGGGEDRCCAVSELIAATVDESAPSRAVMREHYEVLQLPPSASLDAVKSAYKRLALEHHPDKGGDEDDFKRLHQAFEALSLSVSAASHRAAPVATTSPRHSRSPAQASRARADARTTEVAVSSPRPSGSPAQASQTGAEAQARTPARTAKVPPPSTPEAATSATRGRLRKVGAAVGSVSASAGAAKPDREADADVGGSSLSPAGKRVGGAAEGDGPSQPAAKRLCRRPASAGSTSKGAATDEKTLNGLLQHIWTFLF
eukprot:TRINITY_DN17257_c0_g2_i1.p1 TRINITY_DN17257_c0_g2~~TRINITY_DN17257_c0_g2_i1.p1  ORF type:complete len:536 (+),score=126.95 TRINITY_DN17257_c0_g2_i1:141-1748(+)